MEKSNDEALKKFQSKRARFKYETAVLTANKKVAITDAKLSY